MNIQVIDNELKLLGLKNKLQTNLKYHLLFSSKTYFLLHKVIKMLKIKYDENIDIINDLDKFKQNIDNYSLGFELLKVEDWIINWNNSKLINELNKFLDISRSYELEEQIINLQKQIYEVKENNLTLSRRNP